MGKILITLTALLSVLTLVSCSDASCTDTTQVVMKIGFFNQEQNKNIVFDSLSVRGLGHPKDSILYDKTRSVQYISLPLRISVDSTAYEINYYKSNSAPLAQKDTILFYHTNKPFFVSQECGCTVFATITGYKSTAHRLRSIRILKNEINNKTVENAIIVF